MWYIPLHQYMLLHTILGAWCRQRAGLGAWRGALHVNIPGEREWKGAWMNERRIFIPDKQPSIYTYMCIHMHTKTVVSLINAFPPSTWLLGREVHTPFWILLIFRLERFHYVYSLPSTQCTVNTHSSFSCLCGSSPLLQLLPDCLLFSLGSPMLPESSLPPPPPPLTLLLWPLCEPFFGWGDLGFSSFLKRKKRNSSLKWWSSHTGNERGRMRKIGWGRISSNFMNSCRVTQAKTECCMKMKPAEAWTLLILYCILKSAKLAPFTEHTMHQHTLPMHQHILPCLNTPASSSCFPISTASILELASPREISQSTNSRPTNACL